MRVGVVVPCRFEDPAEYLADARALETAGVDSIWLEPSLPPTADDLDPMLLLAAMAAVTSGLRLGILTSGVNREKPGRAFRTLQRLSRSRAMVAVGSGASTVVTTDGDTAERWARIAFPKDRAAWRTAIAEAETAGMTGILVGQDPRLLDLLRNPDQEDDRADLMLSQG